MAPALVGLSWGLRPALVEGVPHLHSLCREDTALSDMSGATCVTLCHPQEILIKHPRPPVLRGSLLLPSP